MSGTRLAPLCPAAQQLRRRVFTKRCRRLHAGRILAQHLTDWANRSATRRLHRLKREALDLTSGIRRPSATRRLPPTDVKTRQTVSKLQGQDGFRKTTTSTTALSRLTEEILWEEIWWEASDWNGLKELGAHKSGIDRSGKNWKENWIEKMYYDRLLSCDIIHKMCTKWCQDTKADEEWEESWEEYFVKDGMSKRWSRKWGKRGAQVWHENWGDEISAEGNGHLWTDKWYEDIFDGEGVVEWGEKWEALLANTCEISKWGENWHKAETEYHRWWKEAKSENNGTIWKSGHSTSGEQWDVTEPLKDSDLFPVVDTDRYTIALDASPQLRGIYVEPRL